MNDPSRLARLNAIKLGVLVRDHVDDRVADAEAAGAVPGEFAGGAALTLDGQAWVLLAERPERGLGGAVAWGLRQGCAQVNVVAEHATGLLARRAAGFTVPISVWHAEGRVLLPAVAEPLPDVPEVPASHREFAAVITAAGAVPREEFGVLFGEVAGLEVCRVVDDPYTGAVRLEVGVGAHDREAFLALHGDRPSAPALSEVVHSVTFHRLHGPTGHPLSRLAQERLLRSRLAADPALIGASEFHLAQPPVPRPNLKDPVPCVGLALIDGVRTAVVCSTGVDLDLVPYAIDARLSLRTEPCVLVVPLRDAVPVQHLLAAAVHPPITIVPVD